MTGGFVITSCNLIWRYCAVNLVALALVLAGGVVLGLAPAMAAAYWAMSRMDTPLDQVARGMFDEWRAEFWRANILALPLGLLIGFALFSGWVAAVQLPFRLVVCVLLGEGLVAVLFAISQSSASLKDTAVNALLFAGHRPLRLLLATLSMPALLLVAWMQPLLALYGLFSLHAACAVWLLGAMRDPARRPMAAANQAKETMP